MAQYFTISDLVKEFGVTARTIRFYEEKGLLEPKRNGSTRIFNAADRVKLKLILRGKRLGFSLQESREIINMYTPDKGSQKQLEILLEKIDEKRQLLKQQRMEINAMLKELQKTESICRDALEEVVNST